MSTKRSGWRPCKKRWIIYVRFKHLSWWSCLKWRLRIWYEVGMTICLNLSDGLSQLFAQYFTYMTLWLCDICFGSITILHVMMELTIEMSWKVFLILDDYKQQIRILAWEILLILDYKQQLINLGMSCILDWWWKYSHSLFI